MSASGIRDRVLIELQVNALTKDQKKMPKRVANKTKKEIAQIERALDTLLCAIEEHTREREAGAALSPKRLKVISWTQLAQADLSPIHDVLHDPVGEILRWGLEVLGWRLFDLGGTALMGKVLDRVVEMGGQWAVRTAILDRRWDGIGNESELWLG